MKQTNNGSLRIEIYLVGLISVCISLSMGFALNRYLPTNSHLATVDITGIIHRFVKMESTLSDSPQALQERTQLFSHQLETTLQTVAEEKHLVLVPKEAVIAGGADLTPEVTQRLEAAHVLSDPS